MHGKQQISVGRQWHLALCSENWYCLCHTQSKLLRTPLEHEHDVMSVTFTAGKARVAWCISCAQTQIMLPRLWSVSSWRYRLCVLTGFVWSKATLDGFIQYFAHGPVIPVEHNCEHSCGNSSWFCHCMCKCCFL